MIPGGFGVIDSSVLTAIKYCSYENHKLEFGKYLGYVVRPWGFNLWCNNVKRQGSRSPTRGNSVDPLDRHNQGDSTVASTGTIGVIYLGPAAIATFWFRSYWQPFGI